MLARFIEWLLGNGAGAMSQMLGLMPRMPLGFDFSGYLEDGYVTQGLGWLNWFVPVNVMLGIVAGWVAAVVAYNVFRYVVGWLKTFKG